MARLTKENNVLIDQYCIDAIQDDETVGMTDNQKLLYLWDRFQADYNIKRIGVPKAFSEWLAGLPIHIDYLNCEILRLAELWGQSIETEREQDKILLGWWDFLAHRYLRLIRKAKDINLNFKC